MAGGSFGMSGHTFDAFVGSQRSFNDYDIAAKLQEKYWRARQQFLSKIEKKEDSCIILSDSKLDAKLEVYRSIDESCARLIDITEEYQNYLYLYSNEENSLGILMKECSKLDKTQAGQILSLTGKSLAQASHQRIKLYMPLLRLNQEMETFHTRAVEDTSETVKKLESKRSQYRASLLWMKDISEKLNPDVYSQLDKFRKVQNQVRSDKKDFDAIQFDVVQKIDLLMASRCNLMNQILGSYQEILLETFERNCNNFASIEELIRKKDIYEYEFKMLKQLNPLKISEDEVSSPPEEAKDVVELMNFDENGNNTNNIEELLGEPLARNNFIDLGLGESNDSKSNHQKQQENNKALKSSINSDLLNLDYEEQIAKLLGKSTSLKGNSSSVAAADDKPSTSHDLMDMEEPKESKSNNLLDFEMNELEQIDNSSYFKSLQGLQL